MKAKKKTKKKLTLNQSISLLAEYDEKSDEFLFEEKELKQILRKIKPAVSSLKNGKCIFEDVKRQIMSKWFDDATEILKEARWRKRLGPLSNFEFRISFWGLALLLFGILGLILGYRDVYHAKQSMHWPKTEGIIVHSKVLKYYDDDSSTPSYLPEIKYTYIVNNKTYTESRLNFEETKGGLTYSKMIVKDYPVDSPVAVYYKPGNPSVAVLDIGIHQSTYYPVICGYAMIFAGLVFFIIKGLFDVDC